MGFGWPDNGETAASGVNEAETARLALEERWRQLAELIEQAREAHSVMQRDPTTLNDPWVVALIRWSAIFDRELGAVQTVYEALQAGAKLSPDEIRAARQTADKLLEIVQTTRERVPA